MDSIELTMDRAIFPPANWSARRSATRATSTSKSDIARVRLTPKRADQDTSEVAQQFRNDDREATREGLP